AAIVLGLAVVAAGPAVAQNFGSPLWNNPKGGTGVTVSADYAKPNSGLGKGSAWGARGSLGRANLTVGVGVTTWKPDGAPDSYKAFAGNAAFRVIGGSLIPLSINLQLGAARQGAANTDSAMTRITAGAGVSANLPSPGLSFAPYRSGSDRWYKFSGSSVPTSTVGRVIGTDLGVGLFGL